jgi:TRAP-type uncharacterized transport system substrate-binding protein
MLAKAGVAKDVVAKLTKSLHDNRERTEAEREKARAERERKAKEDGTGG